MSTQGDIQSFMTALANGTPDHRVDITPDQIALQTGITRDKVNRTLHNMMVRDKVELLRAENGRTIIGFRMLDTPPDKRRKTRAPALAVVEPQPVEEPKPSTNGHSAPRTTRGRRVVYTPKLDEYARQKARFDKMVEEFGDRIEATFREDPMAEEALLLRERLDLVEDQAADWRHKAEGWEHEVNALRTRHIQAVERKAVEAGATVVHSTD